MGSAKAATPAMSPQLVVLTLALLLGAQPVTTDLYLPALPTLTRDLASTVGGAQLTLSTLILCFGLAQLVCGPLADRFGRRPLLLWGLSLYTLASMASALAPSMAVLVSCRAAQGIALAAAVTCGRSIVRDLYEPGEGARVMSGALTGLGLLAMSSPFAGGLLVSWLGWRPVMLLPALYGALTLALVAWRFRETLAVPNPLALRIGPLVENWRLIVRQPTFIAFTALTATSFGGLFVMLSSSSFVFTEVHGVSRTTYGVVIGGFSLAYVGGTWLCRRLLARYGLKRSIFIGGFFSLAGGLSMAGLSLVDVHSLWAIVGPQCLFAIGHGIHQPCGQAGAVGPFPALAGTAASLSGFLMMVVAFAISTAMGQLLNGTVYPLTLGVGLFSVAVAAIAWTLVQRHGEPRAMPIVAAAS